MPGRLADKVSLITGGASGIGRVTALAFAQEGARLVIADLNQAGGDETVRQIQAAGGEAIYIHTDVSQSAQVQRMIAQSVAHYGRLDCAFNNAGFTVLENNAAADCSEEDWDKIIAVNLTGVWLCMKYEIRQMLQQDSGDSVNGTPVKGAIVNAASSLGLVGNGNAPYVASKHGVVGLTKSAAISYSQAGIRVNAIAPGYITTPMTAPLYSENATAAAELAARHPIGRMGKPEEIAEAVIWLCSPAASFVSGHTLSVDGGYVAR